jgi:hypothetical protein
MRSMALPIMQGLALAMLPAVAFAVPVEYRADLTTLNDSGVTGTANLTLDEALGQLTVRITASGLEADLPHPQHIHGRVDDAGNALDSTTPTPERDTDDDGFVELAEGLPDYGPVLLPLTAPPGGAVEDFPTASDGTIDFTQTYDLGDSATFAEGFGVDQLLPLDLREIVLHGMTVSGNAGAGTDGEVDGTPGYKPVLPVAAGEITLLQDGGTPPQEVPEPPVALLLLTGLAAAFGVRRLGTPRKDGTQGTA